MQAKPVRIAVLVLAVWFARCSSTGNRGVKWELSFRHPNLCCPRNGKWSNLETLLDSASITATERFEHMLGKAMEVAPPARIPANKVITRQKISLTCNRYAHVLSGTTAKGF